jgi:hypothetical protein
MGSRLELQTLLETLLGSRNVYFQPPATLTMKYPAIVYERSKLNNAFANDLVYNQNQSYSVTVIDANPDSLIVAKVSQLPKCRPDRQFKNDNLNHDVFILYF